MLRSICMIALICLLCNAAEALVFEKSDTLNIEVELNSEESFKEASHFLYMPDDEIFTKVDAFSEDHNPKPKKRKLKATLLSIFLGHFGVHRIYLGTSAEVPVAYSLTLGGGLGLLPLIDAIAIISTKDLEKFSNNDKVIMWSEPKVD